MFIPFMGPSLRLRKRRVTPGWKHASELVARFWALAAAACHALGLVLDYPLLIALAWTAYFLNLFNLTPVGMLDGGRIVTALSPWLWLQASPLSVAGMDTSELHVWILLFASLRGLSRSSANAARKSNVILKWRGRSAGDGDNELSVSSAPSFSACTFPICN